VSESIIAPLAADGCSLVGALAASSLLVDAWLAMASDDGRLDQLVLIGWTETGGRRLASLS
jgi:hypothetical protein